MAENAEKIDRHFSDGLLSLGADDIDPDMSLSLDDAIENIELKRKSKKTKKSKRKRERSITPIPAHEVSDSDDSTSYVPIHDGKSKGKTDKQVREFGDKPQMANNFQLPHWMHCNVPPGPWSGMPMPMPYNYMAPPYAFGHGFQAWNNDQGAPQSEDAADSSEDVDEELSLTVQTPKTTVATVSLDKHAEALSTDDEVGPAVSESLANVIGKIWDRNHKEEIKDLYAEHKRPANIPSLQKVALDEDIAIGLSDKSKAKRTDALLHSVNNALVKVAVAFTKVIEQNMISPENTDIRQKTVDQSIAGVKMLAYATSLLHTTRREQIKQVLDPGLKQKLKKNSIEATNASHQLFGGDLQKIAKEGWCITN